MGSSKKQTIGYRYFMGLHFGLCHGPVDAFLELRGGDRIAWQGNATSSGSIYIDAPDLWGGEKKEGGIQGTLDVMMGEETQAANSYLQSQLGTPMPAFRGLLSLVFRKGMVGAMNPYPKPWKFKLRRVLQGWHGGSAWYPEKASVSSGVSARSEEIVDFTTGFSTNAPEKFQLIDGWIANTTDNALNTDHWRKPLPSFTVTGFDCDFKLVSAAGGDPLGIALETADGGYQVGFMMRSEDAHDPLQRPRINYWQDPFTLDIYPSALEVGEVYSFSAALDYAAWTYSYTLRDAGGAVLSSGSLSLLPVGTPEYLTFGRTGNTNPSSVGAFGRVAITGYSSDGWMNPAHIVYEALTNPDWGLGYPAGVLDLASFTAAADTFHAEGLGLCLQWTRQDSIEGFIQDVMNHAGAVLAQDPRTALFRLLPIRGGYVVAELPEFRRGLNVIAVESFQRAAITETVNEVTVQYVDAATGKDGSVTVQHLANIQAQGGVASQSIRYPGAPSAALAQRLAMRDLNAKSQPLCKVRLTVDRSGYGILPGEVVRWSDTKLGIVDMPMRVLQVNYGDLTSGAIQLDLAEDVFGMPATAYLGQQEDGWEEPSTAPSAPPAAAAFELPYVALHRTEGASVVNALDEASGFLGMVASRPPGVNYGFALYTRIGSADYTETGAGEWSPGGALTAAISATDTLLALGDTYSLATVEVGDLAMLGEGDAAELVRVDAKDVGANTVTVARGCGDTVAPEAGWPIGTRLWVIQDAGAASVTEYADGETVDAKAVTQASGGQLPLGMAPTDTVTMDQRHARPYVPGQFAINGEAAPTALSGTLTVSWAHRDRLLQADQLVPQSDGSIGPEPGTTYTVRAYVDDVLVNTQTGITGDSALVSPAGNGLARIELEAVRDGLTSWHMQARTFNYTTGPVDNRVIVGGDRRVTASGDGRISIG